MRERGTNKQKHKKKSYAAHDRDIIQDEVPGSHDPSIHCNNLQCSDTTSCQSLALLHTIVGWRKAEVAIIPQDHPVSFGKTAVLDGLFKMQVQDVVSLQSTRWP